MKTTQFLEKLKYVCNYIVLTLKLIETVDVPSFSTPRSSTQSTLEKNPSSSIEPNPIYTGLSPLPLKLEKKSGNVL